jgi:hypothetical protein
VWVAPAASVALAQIVGIAILKCFRIHQHVLSDGRGVIR